jgi:steroid delta-isomerase-like uncharacterized protein
MRSVITWSSAGTKYVRHIGHLYDDRSGWLIQAGAVPHGLWDPVRMGPVERHQEKPFMPRPDRSFRFRRYALVMVAVAMLFGAHTAPWVAAQDAGTPDTLPDLFVAFGEAWSSCDPAQLTTVYAADAVFEEAVLGGVVTTNHEDLGNYLLAVCAGFPDLTATPVRGFMTEDRAVIEWILTGTYTGQFGDLLPGSGQQVEVRVASILTVSNGLITQEVDYWDVATLLSQFGALGGAEATPAS